MDILSEWRLFPPNLSGYLIGACVAWTSLCVLNWAALLISRLRPVDSSSAHRMLRPGYVTIYYYMACASHIIILGIPLVFLGFHFTLIWSSFGILAALITAVIIHTTFWIICLYRLIENRHFHEQPISLVVSYAVTSLILVYPLFSWYSIFSKGFKEPYVFYYISEALFAFCIFGALASGSTLKRARYSPWDNFFSKLAAIWPYMWPRNSILLRIYVWMCVVLLVFGRIINVVIPLYSKWIVDDLSGTHPNFCYQLIIVATFLKFLQGSGAMGGLLNTIRTFLWIRVQQYTTLEIEVDMLKHLHQLSLRFHLSRKTGEVIRVMDRGTTSINTLLSYLLFNVGPTIADIILASIFFFVQFNVYFGFLVFATMIIYLSLTIILTEWRSKYRVEMNALENKASSVGVDSLLNYETIKYYNAEALEVSRYKKAFEKYQIAEYKSNASLALLNVCQNVIIGAGLIGGSLLAAWMIAVAGEMSVGDYVLFTTYILQLYGPLNFFGTIYRVVQRAFIDMENMLELFREDAEIYDDPAALELEKKTGSIEFRNVTFSYKPDKIILDNISFTVNPAETVAIVGPSGSGKTTIIRLLFRLYDVTSGEVLFNGRDVRTLLLDSLRSRIGIVPQDTVLFNETVRFNIRYGKPDASDEEVEEAAKAASIHEFIRTHPDGYECLVGERGLKLSGGEKQRVAIARTILKDPEYVVLDEATSALDSKTERAIQGYLSDLCDRKTCVIVAHRLSTIMHADKILVLNAGRIVEAGSHDELLSRNAVYAEMWSLQNRTEQLSQQQHATNLDELPTSSGVSNVGSATTTATN